MGYARRLRCQGPLKVEMARQLPSHLVVLGHPSPTSFNAAVAECYIDTARSQHHGAELRDLYALGFDPLLREEERSPSGAIGSSPEIEAEIERLRQCDVLTFVYPLWFGMPPAIIKGYIDRVMGAGFRIDHLTADGGMMRGKRLAVITSSGSRISWLEEQGMWISLRQSFDRYLTKVFGFAAFDHHHLDSIGEDLSENDASAIFFNVREFARSVCAAAAMPDTA